MTEANAEATPDGAAPLLSPAELPATDDAREAYFKSLRLWVSHMQIVQNATANFPYYLMANYPQLLAAPALLLPPFAGAAASTTATAGAAAAPNAGGVGAFPLRMNGLMRNPLRQQELIDNPARNAESKSDLYTCKVGFTHM